MIRIDVRIMRLALVICLALVISWPKYSTAQGQLMGQVVSARPEVIEVTFRVPKGEKGDRISYKLFDKSNNLVSQGDLALKAEDGDWGIRNGDMMGSGGNKFRNVTKNMKFAPTPLSSEIGKKGIEVYILSIIKPTQRSFSSGSYRLDLLYNKTVVQSITLNL